MRFAKSFRRLYRRYAVKGSPMWRALKVVKEDPSMIDASVEDLRFSVDQLKGSDDKEELYQHLEALLYLLTFAGRWGEAVEFIEVWRKNLPERGTDWWYAFKFYEAHMYLHFLNRSGMEELLKDPMIAPSIITEILHLNGKWEGRYIAVPRSLNPTYTVYQEIIGIPCLNVWDYIHGFLQKEHIHALDLLKWFSLEGLVVRSGGGNLLRYVSDSILESIPESESYVLALYGNPHSGTKAGFVAEIEKMKLQTKTLGLVDEYYRYDLTLKFIKGTVPSGVETKLALDFMRKFRRDVYTIYVGIKWRTGKIRFDEFYDWARDFGTLGVFDHLFHMEKIATDKPYLNFTGSLHIHKGLRSVPVRETSIRTRSALVGLAYILVFMGGRRNYIALERFLMRHARDLYKVIFKRYSGNPNTLQKRLKKATREDISRIQKVLTGGELYEGKPLDLGCNCERNGVFISNAHNFFISARYGLALVREEESWAEEFRKLANRIRKHFLIDYTKGL